MENYLKGKTACAYIRVSSNEQTEYSPESQIKLIKKYAFENGIDLLENYIYKENGISGSETSNRPAFQKMILDAKNRTKPFDIILVYDFSRFARNKEESVIYKSQLRKKYNIDVVSITQPLSQGKERVIVEAMYEAMDEYYLQNLAENVRRGRNEKASRGEWNGVAPYGYTYDKKNKSLIIKEDEANVVNMIFDEFIKLEKLRPITNKLNSEGILTRNGKAWEDRVVKYVLKNITYISKIKDCDGNLYDGKHKSIINTEKWNIVSKIMKKRDCTNFKYQKSSKTQEHWLRGLLICSKCGGRLCINKARNKNNPAYFQCGHYSKSICHESHYISVKKMENAILEQIKKTFTFRLELNIRTPIFEDNFLNILQDNLKKLEKKYDRIQFSYEEGIDTLEEYKDKKNRILNEIEMTKNKINNYNIQELNNIHKDEIYNKCKSLYELFKNPEIDEKIKYDEAHILFEKIIYNKKNNEITIYYN